MFDTTCISVTGKTKHMRHRTFKKSKGRDLFFTLKASKTKKILQETFHSFIITSKVKYVILSNSMLIMQQMPNTLCFGRKTIKLKNTLTQELLFLLSYFLSVCLFSVARVHSKSSALSQKVVFHVIVYGLI